MLHSFTDPKPEILRNVPGPLKLVVSSVTRTIWEPKSGSLNTTLAGGGSIGVSGWIAKSVVAREYGGTPCGIALVENATIVSETKSIVSERFLDICFLLEE